VGPQVETNVFKGVDDAHHLALVIEDAGVGIGSIALMMDAFVPVVEGGGTGLPLNGIQARIFPRWLVKVPMDANAHPPQGRLRRGSDSGVQTCR
jgi:hypothetical protein